MYGQEIANIFSSVRKRTAPCSPVEWAEKNRVLSSVVSALSGRVSYDNSPYLKEIVNNFDPRSNVNEIAVIKGAQLGFSQLVLETVIGFTIGVYPRSMLYLTADQQLAEENIETRVDSMLVSTGLENKLKPSSNKKKNRSTGDTKGKKEFAGGILYAKGANSANSLRSISVPILLFDEIDALKTNIKGQGSPTDLANSRTSAFESVRKVFYGSTPTTLQQSNIYPLFKKGDCREWYVPCPHCQDYQKISWSNKKKFTDIVGDFFQKESDFGIKFELNKDGSLNEKSVFYKCINGCEIKESSKYEMNLRGEWRATQKSKKDNFVSYHINSLVSNFSSWVQIVQEFLESKKDKNKLQVFVNNRLGEVWQEEVKVFDVTKLNKNVMPYEAGIVPNSLALEHGNGKICLLICAVDVNGSTDKNNGWLAVEVKGFCSNGASYSICKAEIHGRLDDPNLGSWLALEKIMDSKFLSDDKLTYRIMTTFVDSGSRTQIVYDFTNKFGYCYAVKGTSSKVAYNYNKQKHENAKVYNLNVNKYKDNLSQYLQKKHSSIRSQPDFFMNFPKEEVRTGFENLNLENCKVVLAGNGWDKKYFSTFGSEFKELSRDLLSGDLLPTGQWKKKDSRAYNHFWDVNVYLFAGLDLTIDFISKFRKEEDPNLFSVLRTMENHLHEFGEPYF